MELIKLNNYLNIDLSILLKDFQHVAYLSTQDNTFTDTDTGKVYIKPRLTDGTYYNFYQSGYELTKKDNQFYIINASTYYPINKMLEIPKDYTDYNFKNRCFFCKDITDTRYFYTNNYQCIGFISICEDCFNDNIITCSECEEQDLTDNQNYQFFEDNTYCEGCTSNCLSFCEDCEEYNYQDNVSCVENGDRYVCDDCLSNYTECESCCEFYHIDNVYDCEECGIAYCQNCRHNCDNEDNNYDNRRGGYNIKTEDFTHINLINNLNKGSLIDVDRKIGVELEAVNVQSNIYLNDKLPNYVGIIDDGSLSNGVEIKTPPSKQAELENVIKTTCKTMQEAELQANRSCGLHIHIDCSDIKNNLKTMQKLMLSFYYAENILLAMLPKSRLFNTYCKAITENYHLSDFKSYKTLDTKWYKSPKSIALNKMQNKYDSSRYTGANLHSVFYRGTLEIRCHSGTLNSGKILKWIYILLHVFNYALKDYKLKDLKKLQELDTFTKKLNYFCKLFKIKNSVKKYIRQRVIKFHNVISLNELYI